MKEGYFHGDVVLIKIDEVPEGVVVPDGIMARGEATGHHHRMLEGAVVLKGFDDKIYVKVTARAARIVHQEHGDDIGHPTYRFKDLPRGNYEVRIKREYRYGEETQVLD